MTGQEETAKARWREESAKKPILIQKFFLRASFAPSRLRGLFNA